jgi:hypothetical protein
MLNVEYRMLNVRILNVVDIEHHNKVAGTPHSIFDIRYSQVRYINESQIIWLRQKRQLRPLHQSR